MIAEARKPGGIPVAIGVVLEVVYRPGLAVFLNVALRHHHTDNQTDEGAPLEATVRWAPGYAGLGEIDEETSEAFGSWWIPRVGTDVVCLFPGVAPNGTLGDDLENGYAIAVVSSKPEPPVDEGLAGPLSATRKIYRGERGVAHDIHVQGDLDWEVFGNEIGVVAVDPNADEGTTGNRDHTVEGDEVTVVEGTESRSVTEDSDHTYKATRTVTVEGDLAVTVEGNEDRETEGLFQWLFRAATDFLADVAFKVKSSTTLNLEGVTQLNVDSGTKIVITVGSTKIEVTSGLIRLTGTDVEVVGAFTVTGDSVLDGDVDLGGLGGPGVGRIGDEVAGNPDVIIEGSTKVRAVD